ncbi:PspA/IM30 family protein [Psychrobacillus sp. FJAT-51614]|uniref:PspA/IM30 family protein n=1 Tax=Psychrobacillus mangrovi TaxID=3117745 RepID=A0ABU8F554_9BACI
MTSLLKRLKYSVEADLHKLFDKKEEKNPIAMLNQYIREAEKQTEQTGKWLERQGKLKQELEKELAETMQMVEKRKNQVELATASGEEDLSAFAQAELNAYSERTSVLQNSIQQTTEELFGLERKYEEMKHKIKDMKVRQLQLMGKENVTRAHHQMDRILQPEQKEKNFGTFQDMEQYIERLGQKIEKEHEITSMEQRLEMLEKNAQPKTEIV